MMGPDPREGDDRTARTEPARRNPLSVPLRRELRAALEAAHADDGCRALVITGAGTAFSSGGDLASMPRGDSADARDRCTSSPT
jgi:2-(1,2-epoxy-1,2-dihydrophenyl)acetyl-CoA isomerase